MSSKTKMLWLTISMLLTVVIYKKSTENYCKTIIKNNEEAVAYSIEYWLRTANDARFIRRDKKSLIEAVKSSSFLNRDAKRVVSIERNLLNTMWNIEFTYNNSSEFVLITTSFDQCGRLGESTDFMSGPR